MSDYNYYFAAQSGSLVNLALRIENLINILPSSWGNSNINSYVGFDVPITGNNEVLLTGFLNNTGIINIPNSTGQTVFRINDVMDNRQSFRSTLSTLPFNIYSSGSFYIMQFNRSLTNANKTSIRNAWANLLVEI